MSNQTPGQGNMNDQPQGRQLPQRTPNNRRDQRVPRPEGQRPPQAQANPQRSQIGEEGSNNRNFRNRRRTKPGEEVLVQQVPRQERVQEKQKRTEPRQENKMDAKVDNKPVERQDSKQDSRNDRQRFNKPRIEQPRARIKREESVEDIRADIEQVEKDIELEIKQIRAIKLGL